MCLIKYIWARYAVLCRVSSVFHLLNKKKNQYKILNEWFNENNIPKNICSSEKKKKKRKSDHKDTLNAWLNDRFTGPAVVTRQSFQNAKLKILICQKVSINKQLVSFKTMWLPWPDKTVCEWAVPFHCERPSKLGSVQAGRAVCLFNSLSIIAYSESRFSTSSCGVQDMSCWSLYAPRNLWGQLGPHSCKRLNTLAI